VRHKFIHARVRLVTPTGQFSPNIHPFVTFQFFSHRAADKLPVLRTSRGSRTSASPTENVSHQSPEIFGRDVIRLKEYS
jgi:hypothetical protein